MVRKSKKRKNRGLTQADAIKSVRKQMPPATKVIKPKPWDKKRSSSKNWRDLLDED